MLTDKERLLTELQKQNPTIISLKTDAFKES
jgi:hypothetical protein